MSNPFRFPDNRKCPRCGYQMPLTRLGLKRGPKRTWECPWCGSLLRNAKLSAAFYPGLGTVAAAIAYLSLIGEAIPAIVCTAAVGLLLVPWSLAVVIAEEKPVDETELDGADRPESRKRLARRHSLFRMGRTAVLAYVVGVLALFVFQKSLIYFPTRELAATPADEGMLHDEVRLTTSDGVKIHGWFVMADNAPRATVLFCHGNAGNMSHRLSTLRILHDLGVDAFIFDYRGYGNSEGSPDEQGTYRDAEAAWQYLVETRGVPREKIIVHGRSLGGAVAARVAARHRPRALILESTFTSIPDMGVGRFPIFPVRLICLNRYDTMGMLAQVACPILFVHSRDDEIVPFSHGEKLHERALGCPFLDISGGHNDGFLTSGRTYTDGLARFIEDVVN